MSELRSYLDVTRTRDLQFDENWHPFSEFGMKLMKGKRAAFRLGNNGGGAMTLEAINSLPGMDFRNMATVLVNGRRIGRIRITQSGRLQESFFFKPFVEDVVEVEIRVQRLIHPSDFGHADSRGFGLGVYSARLAKTEVPCMEPWVTVFVTWDGKVRTCCVSEKEFGDLRERGIDEIWNGKEFTNFRRVLGAGAALPDCRECFDNHRQKFELFSAGEVIAIEPLACRKRRFPV